MIRFGIFLRRMREGFALPMSEVAKRTGMSIDGIGRIERKVTSPEQVQGATLTLLAQVYLRNQNATGAELLREYKSTGKKNGATPQRYPAHKNLGRPIPIINKIAAGKIVEQTNLEYPPGIADGYTYAPQIADPDAFALVVEGDSMEPDYRMGDVVIFSPAESVEDGDDACVQLQGKHDDANCLKRVHFDGKRLILQSLNPKYAPEIVSGDDVTKISKAVLVQRSVNRKKSTVKV